MILKWILVFIDLILNTGRNLNKLHRKASMGCSRSLRGFAITKDTGVFVYFQGAASS
jgi:hypothetical protein